MQEISNETLKALLDANAATQAAHAATMTAQFAAMTARFDKQDQRTDRTEELMTLRFKELSNEISTTYMRKDLSDKMFEGVLSRLKSLEDKPQGRLLFISMSCGIGSGLIVILSYLHVIPHP